ncbi:hypothetical protein ACFL27_22625, partial [candidate division CSSED10-310 bacterium]
HLSIPATNLVAPFVTAKLHHPGIVRIVEEGSLHGMPWYAMDLLNGMTLREFISGRKAAIQELVASELLHASPEATESVISEPARTPWWTGI